MSNNDLAPADDDKPRALRRAELLSRSLAETARRFRISKRTRQASGIGSFRMRRHARLFRMIFISSFILLALVPSITVALYFGVIASPQYIAETKFAIRTGELPKLDGVGAATGIPIAKIAQDTQVVANYMESRAIVEALEKKIDLRSMYSSDDIDWFARFKRTKPIEKFVDYWKSRSAVTLQGTSGIVVFSVHAFSAGDAKRIADAVLSLSESLVNDMNDRMMKSTIADAEREFARSADRLARARAEYQKVRNESGILSTAEAGKGLADLLTLVQKERLRLQQEFDTQSRYVSNTAPQMRALRDRLRSLDDQIAELESKMTTQRTSTGPDKVLSESITRFAQQDLEHRIAERQYAAAASALELARITSQRQLVYLVAFVRPALPEESRYPRPVLFTALGILGSLAVWGAFCGLLTAIRNHMA